MRFLSFFFLFLSLPKHWVRERTMRARARASASETGEMLSETEAAKISSSQTHPVRFTRRLFARFSCTDDDVDDDDDYNMTCSPWTSWINKPSRLPRLFRSQNRVLLIIIMLLFIRQLLVNTHATHAHTSIH